MGTTPSLFEAGPPSLDLERPVLFYEDLESEGKLKVDTAPRLTLLGEQLYHLYLTNQLPAADLFWVNYNTRKQVQYFAILGQLYELFLTPHTLAFLPNHYSCSYLKLYEAQVAWYGAEYLQHFLRICEQNLTNVFIYPDTVYLDINQQKRKMLHDFKTAVLKCRNRVEESMIVSLSIKDKEWYARHRIFVTLKKTNQFKNGKRILQFVYIDPHGFKFNDAKYKRQRFISALLVQEIRPYYHIDEFDLECPTLQTWEQGGSCVQWFFYNLYFFLKDSNAATHMSSIRNIREMTANIHLFELSLFLRTLPLVNLTRYHTIFLYKNAYIKTLESECGSTDMRNVQKHLSNLSVDNCLRHQSCPESCAQCGDRCNFQSAVVLLQNGECKPLSPKMIAKKMLYLYAELRKIAGRDPSVVTPEAIEQQLNYKEPKTLEDYKRLYNFTEDDINHLQQLPGK